MPTTIVATAYGRPEVLEARQVILRAPGRGEVSMDVHAAGVNPVDIKAYAGGEKGNDPAKLPLSLRVEASGVVTAVGEDSVGPAGPIRVGVEVIAYRVLGAYADDITVPAAAIVPKPASLSWKLPVA